MKTALHHTLFMMTCLTLGTVSVAHAQTQVKPPPSMFDQQQPVIEETPPDALPPMPQEAIDHATQEDNMAPPQQLPPQTTGNFAPEVKMPPLPPSTPCTMASIVGVWKLIDVYEIPSGPEMAKILAHPYQYLLFSQDSTFGRYDLSQTEIPEKAVIDGVHRTNTGLNQYVIDATGLMYFYQQGIVVDSMVCFIVADRAGPFFPGQMLMMPPKGQQTTRLVKVYGKGWAVDSAPRPSLRILRPPSINR